VGGRNRAAVQLAANLGIRYVHALRLFRGVSAEWADLDTYDKLLDRCRAALTEERGGRKVTSDEPST